MQQPKLLHEGAFAYSDMVRTNTDHLEYDLPPRLTQTVKFSTDLSVWNTSLPQITITQSGVPAGANLTNQTYTLSSDFPLPTIFARIYLVSAQTP